MIVTHISMSIPSRRHREASWACSRPNASTCLVVDRPMVRRRREKTNHGRASGPATRVLSVVLAGALVTYGGVSLFVAFFVLALMAHALFRAAATPRLPRARKARAMG